MRMTTCLFGAALSVSLWPACKTQQAGIEQKAVSKVADPSADIDKDNAPAVLTPEVAQRTALALTRHPEPFVAVRTPTRAPSLRATAGKPVSFDLAMPGIARWSEATIARFVVRLPGGVQDTVPVDSKSAQGLATYTFPSSGPAMLMLCAGPKGAPVADPTTTVTHCTKMILTVDGAKPGEGGDDFVGETGLPLDVEPLVPPNRLAVGSELPVRFHYMTEEEGNIEVAAIRPDGSVDKQVTSRSGVAHFQMTQPGRWVIRFAKAEGEGERVGELVFEIAEKVR
jgi:uncharacterized protein DUF4198